MEAVRVSANAFARLLCVICCVVSGVRASQVEVAGSNIRKMNAKQIIRAFGFPSEVHTIETPDGYLLELDRIPHGRQGPSSRNPNLPPVFVQHGIFCSAASHLIIGPDDALPFLLADMGFDVWLGNVRGNSYSRAHVTLDPDGFKFWNFTWHEAALGDISTSIDFVLENTNKNKLIYIGHSMGTTMFFVLMSMMPEYNRKIELALLMAPVAYVNHTQSPVYQLFSPLESSLYDLFVSLGMYEFLPTSAVLNLISDYFCQRNNLKRDICGSVIYLLTGDRPNSYDRNFINILLRTFPNGFSAKGVSHYAQLITTGTFRRYDHGTAGNLREYGTPTPPDYDLSKITAPMIFYAAKHDFIVNMKDATRLARQLPSLKHMFVIEYAEFGHLDFLFSENLRGHLHDKIIHDLMDHLRSK